jgi:hypothetical protein
VTVAVEPSRGPAGGRPRWHRSVGRLTFGAACLPFTVVALLWARGQFVGDRVVWYGNRAVLLVATSQGGLAVGADLGDWSQFARPTRFSYERGKPDAFTSDMNGVFALNVDPGDTFSYGSRAGVTWFRYAARSGSYSINRLSAPIWMIAILAAAPPACCWAVLALRRVRYRRRRDRGLCFACGYDLRGSAGRCPECGTVVSAVASERRDKENAAPPAHPVVATLMPPAGGVEPGGPG